MRFAFTEQQEELRATVRSVLERECTPAHLRAFAAGEDDGAHRWAVLAELGAPGILVEESAGGLGLTAVDLVGVLEEAGRHALPEPLAETALLAAPLLAALGDTARLEKLAAGELVAAVGGIDVTADGPTTSTRPAPDITQGTVLSPRVAGTSSAQLFLLAWVVSGTDWQIHALDRDAVELAPTPSIDATRGLAEVEWTPWSFTLATSGERAGVLVGDLADRAALGTAAQLCGLADRMIELAADYARARHQFGRPIGSFQAVKHLLANARVRLEFARPATYRAADSVSRALPERSAHASMAKALASDAADLAARAALQVHGAIGYTWECDLHLYMKRAWALAAAWGDAPAHRARVLAAALGSTDR